MLVVDARRDSQRCTYDRAARCGCAGSRATESTGDASACSADRSTCDGSNQ
jgi:hypothetical protein